MSRLTKTMLVLMVINIAASALFLPDIINVSDLPGFYLTLPLAAIFYGMFLICRVLDKEVAAFDAEEHAHHGHAAPDIQPHNVKSLHDHNHHESLAA